MPGGVIGRTNSEDQSSRPSIPNPIVATICLDTDPPSNRKAGATEMSMMALGEGRSRNPARGEITNAFSVDRVGKLKGGRFWGWASVRPIQPGTEVVVSDFTAILENPTLAET